MELDPTRMEAFDQIILASDFLSARQLNHDLHEFNFLGSGVETNPTAYDPQTPTEPVMQFYPHSRLFTKPTKDHNHGIIPVIQWRWQRHLIAGECLHVRAELRYLCPLLQEKGNRVHHDRSCILFDALAHTMIYPGVYDLDTHALIPWTKSIQTVCHCSMESAKNLWRVVRYTQFLLTEGLPV